MKIHRVSFLIGMGTTSGITKICAIIPHYRGGNQLTRAHVEISC